MEGSDFDEIAFFDAIARGGVRALLIGRRALVVLGFPVLTADYDFWIHVDDIERFNEAAAPFDLVASRTPEQARRHGRYALENDEHVDVLVARAVPTTQGDRVVFDDVWGRRRACPLTPSLSVALPSHADLIATKRFASRPKDLEDIRLLELVGPEGEP
jgi:hypothetical protein